VLVLLLGVGLVAALAVLGVRLLTPPSAPPRVSAPPVASLAPGADDPVELARAACVRVDLAAQAVRANGTAEGVRRELAAARVLAAEAFRQEPGFAALSGAAAALDEAVRRDAPDAGPALRVALAECRPLR
jgi:hypothetical protein